MTVEEWRMGWQFPFGSVIRSAQVGQAGRMGGLTRHVQNSLEAASRRVDGLETQSAARVLRKAAWLMVHSTQRLALAG